MKQSIFFMILMFCALPLLNAQLDPISEDEIKSYILSQIESYDPIMGIYIVKSYQIRSTPKKTDTYEMKGKDLYKVAIVRKGSCFIRVEIPNKVNINILQCLIYPTSIPDTYLWNKEEFKPTSIDTYEGSLYELTPQQIIDQTELTAKDIQKHSYRVYYKTVWTKIFPSESYINQIIKKPETRKEDIILTGTGFAITSTGYIATNYHVIEGAKSISIKGINRDFNTTFNAKVVITDQKNDLAIIKVDDQDFNQIEKIPYTLKESLSEVGEDIFVLGYPLTGSMGEEVKLTNGIVSSRTGYEGDISLYQISAPVQPGNSGGPLFDSKGNVIGIVSAKHTQAENAGYAIKTSYLNNLINLVDPPLPIPSTNTISSYSLPEKVKTLRNFVFIIIVDK